MLTFVLDRLRLSATQSTCFIRLEIPAQLRLYGARALTAKFFDSKTTRPKQGHLDPKVSLQHIIIG